MPVNDPPVVSEFVLLTTFQIPVEGRYAQASAIVCLVYVVGIVLAWRLPETQGRPLPE